MERDTLSMRQLMAILWAGLLGPAAELLPGTAARAGGVGALGVTAAGAGMLASGWALWRLARRSGNLACGIRDAYGGFLGKVILFIYMVWCQIWFAVRLRQSARRLVGGGQHDGAVWFFVIVLGLMALWFARGRLGAFGRAGELMFVCLAVTGGVVLVLALRQVRAENLLAAWNWGLEDGADLIWPGAGVLGYGLFAGFLMRPKNQEQAGRKWVGWTGMGCVALILAQIVALGTFGPALTGRLDSPFFHLAKGVAVEGAFQRVESVVAAIWTFSDLILLGTILWAVRNIGGTLWPGMPGHSVVTASALVGIVLGIALLGGRLPLPSVPERILTFGSLILGLGVPLLAMGTKERKGRG